MTRGCGGKWKATRKRHRSRNLGDSRADYTHGGATGLISERASGVSKFYHGDQLGSTRGITSAAQGITDSREYDSFGLTIATTGATPTPFGFVGAQGYRSDSQSGLQLLGARYYDASLGRFISRDPIGYGGGLNLYGYCGNDPVNATDPSGHAAQVLLMALPTLAALGPVGWTIIAVAVIAVAFAVAIPVINDLASDARRPGPTPNPRSRDYHRERPPLPRDRGPRHDPDPPPPPTLDQLTGGPQGPPGCRPQISPHYPTDWKSLPQGPEMPGDIDGVGPW